MSGLATILLLAAGPAFASSPVGIESQPTATKTARCSVEFWIPYGDSGTQFRSPNISCVSTTISKDGKAELRLRESDWIATFTVGDEVATVFVSRGETKATSLVRSPAKAFELDANELILKFKSDPFQFEGEPVEAVRFSCQIGRRLECPAAVAREPK